MDRALFTHAAGVALAGVLALTATGFAVAPPPDTPQAPTVLLPTSPKTTVYTSCGAEIDVSNRAQGYLTARYTGDSTARLKLRISKGEGALYNYDLNTQGDEEVFSFTEGSGDYTVQIFQNVGGSTYAQLLSQTVTVELKDETLPFLYPSQFVHFGPNSKAVEKGAELTASAKGELEKVSIIYNYVVGNIVYDTAKAQSAADGSLAGYLPDVDQVLTSGKGICFDYAALMTAMLRSQGIPAKLVVGYVGDIYHAWISTYIKDVGWVDGIVYFDGVSWKLMDPTLAASGGKGVNSLLGDSSRYHQIYTY